MNIYKELGWKYIEKGLSVVPDKYGEKGFALKNLSKHYTEIPTKGLFEEYSSSLTKSNIAVMLGSVSGIVALDLDTTDEEILKVILPLLPNSPVEKIGSKGFTRFFRYTGQPTYMVKFDDEVVLEILSDKKKTTIPPSLHPSGVNYKWSKGDLLDIDVDSLPILPPMLIGNIEQALRNAFPDKVELKSDKTKVSSGRNAHLVQFAGKLIANKSNLDNAVKQLLEEDKKNDVPYFKDLQEWAHGDEITNAIKFYSSVLDSANATRHNTGKVYETPLISDNEIVTKTKTKTIKKAKHAFTCVFCKKDSMRGD